MIPVGVFRYPGFNMRVNAVNSDGSASSLKKPSNIDIAKTSVLASVRVMRGKRNSKSVSGQGFGSAWARVR